MYDHGLIYTVMVILLLLSYTAIAVGVIGISYSFFVLIRMKRKNAFLIARYVIILFMGLFWFINFNPFNNDYPILRWAELDAGLKNTHKINTDISIAPIILAEDNYDNLVVFTYLANKTPFGLTKYFINCEIQLVSENPIPSKHQPSIDQLIPNQDLTDKIDEERICDIEYFPDIWFGIVYFDKRDSIRINGEKPELFDISFRGVAYEKNENYAAYFGFAATDHPFVMQKPD